MIRHVRYEVHPLGEAKGKGFPPPSLFTWDDFDDWDFFTRSAVYRISGDVVTFLGMDGGELEDQTLWRNWSWDAEELREAWWDGFYAGESHAEPQP